MSHDPWAQQMQAAFEAPASTIGPEAEVGQFAAEQGSQAGLYESEQPVMWGGDFEYVDDEAPAPDQPQEGHYQQAQAQQRAPAPQPAPQAQYHAPAPPAHHEPDPVAFRQQWEEQLAQQRYLNQQRLEHASYAQAMRQIHGPQQARGRAPAPYPVQHPTQLNAAYHAKRRGFWIGLAVGAGALTICWAAKKWLKR